jgi:hypothetical protein
VRRGGVVSHYYACFCTGAKISVVDEGRGGEVVMTTSVCRRSYSRAICAMRCLHAGVHECMAGSNGLAQLGWAGLGWMYAAACIRARCEMRDARWRRRTRGEARRDAAERV